MNLCTSEAAKLNRTELENLKSMSSDDLLSNLCNYDTKMLSVLTLVEPSEVNYIPKEHANKLNNTILAIYPNLKGVINGLYKYLGY